MTVVSRCRLLKPPRRGYPEGIPGNTPDTLDCGATDIESSRFGLFMSTVAAFVHAGPQHR
ncbi:hypothetical protein [Nocardia flavorosea]|uniref:Uncharacterized protein n=1 Tax=Nocardia flavorosea TaxID=53429 RepID=A0A846YR58_9NOCA|nr:hypothetical protein [Nocardia flavorosea]NKY59994.1 hypothetical protein [Nocardia flavorosea]